MAFLDKSKLMSSSTEPVNGMYVTLNPGDFRFCAPTSGKPAMRLNTLLGSCVSVILWHPSLRSGGMSHSLLPSRSAQADVKEIDGRYCVDAINLFRQELARVNLPAQQFHTYIVGGANMFANSKGPMLIGDRNVEVTRICLKEAGFYVRAEHVSGNKYRKVELDLDTGSVVVTVNQQRIKL
jgi:chemotaxis protein CheD